MSARKFIGDSVVRLPGASTRKVQQRWNKAAREARATLRHAQGTEFPHKLPCIRKAEQRAAVLAEITPTPAIMLVEAILAELDEATRLRVIGRLGKHVLSKPGRQAFELAGTTMLNFGEQWRLVRALERATEGHT